MTNKFKEDLRVRKKRESILNQNPDKTMHTHVSLEEMNKIKSREKTMKDSIDGLTRNNKHFISGQRFGELKKQRELIEKFEKMIDKELKNIMFILNHNGNYINPDVSLRKLKKQLQKLKEKKENGIRNR